MAASGGARAQLVETLAAAGVADTLAGSSVSGGMNPTELTNRAKGAVSASNQRAASSDQASSALGAGATSAGYTGQGGVGAPLPPAAPAPGLPSVGGGFSPAAAPPGGVGPGAQVDPAFAQPAPLPPQQLPGVLGGGQPAVVGGFPGVSPGAGAIPGAIPGAAGATPTPTPIPTINVLTGLNVKDAVTGAILQSPTQLVVLLSTKDQFQDDGIHDNGIAGDNIRGNVERIENKFVSAETNNIKNRLVSMLGKVEGMSPLRFAGPVVATTDQNYRLRNSTNPQADLRPTPADYLDLEKERDDKLADWNRRFLAVFRSDQQNPKSRFYEVYVPEAPQPPRYQLPPGYNSPQKRYDGSTPEPGAATAGGGAAQPPPGAGGRPNIYNGDSVF